MDVADDLLRASGLPLAEARALLAQQLGVTREHLVAHPERPVAMEHALAYRTLVRRRQSGEPMAYLLGVQSFYGRDFRVSRDVLVPRADTETLIDVALKCLRGVTAPRVLELGTGSGCIAVTLKLERPDAVIAATDMSVAALAIARINARARNADIQWLQGDWYAPVPHGALYDLIVSNPPYVAAGDPHLPALQHEPPLALTDGADGLRCLHLLAGGARRHLASGGWIVLEHGHDQGPAVARMLADAGFRDVATTQDAGGRDRVGAGRL